METYRRHNNIIENKLQQLPQADVSGLWNGMHAILDEAMPQRDKKRLFFGWLFTGKTLLICSSISLLAIAAYSLYPSSSKPSLKPGLIANNQNTTTAYESKTEKEINTINGNKPSLQNSIQKQVSKNNSSVNTNQNFQIKQQDSYSTGFNLQQASATVGFKMSSVNNEKNGKEFRTIPGDDPSLSQPNEILSGRLYYSKFNLPQTINEQNLVEELEQERSQSLNQVVDENGTFVLSLQKENDSLVRLRQKRIGELRNRGAYIGVMMGIDLSTVHFNSFNYGSNKGIVLGYSFNKKWSIETGVYWNKKTFSGDSSAFDLKNYTPQSGVKIVSAKGDIRLYEIPFSLQYTILQNRNALFLTAGISSYYIKWESYKYGYEYNGQSGYSFFSPQNATKNWFSVANFSFGYNYRIGSMTSLRIEPYIKIPVKNIGFSNMPVMSTGLNIGFTRKLSRL